MEFKEVLQKILMEWWLIIFEPCVSNGCSAEVTKTTEAVEAKVVPLTLKRMTSSPDVSADPPGWSCMSRRRPRPHDHFPTTSEADFPQMTWLRTSGSCSDWLEDDFQFRLTGSWRWICCGRWWNFRFDYFDDCGNFWRTRRTPLGV